MCLGTVYKVRTQVAAYFQERKVYLCGFWNLYSTCLMSAIKHLLGVLFWVVVEKPAYHYSFSVTLNDLLVPWPHQARNESGVPFNGNKAQTERIVAIGRLKDPFLNTHTKAQIKNLTPRANDSLPIHTVLQNKHYKIDDETAGSYLLLALGKLVVVVPHVMSRPIIKKAGNEGTRQ